MPTYEYECKDCKHVEDFIRSIENRDDKAICLECDGIAERIISKPALVWAPTSGGYR